MSALCAEHPQAERCASQPAGVLLVNLGTPEAPTPAAVRRYLGEFLSDPSLVDLPRALWLPILRGVILNLRPAKTARAYAAIWRRDTDESPLRHYTRRQAERLQERLQGRAAVAYAMRYGAPSIAEGLASLRAAGARRIRVLPLYPQYSRTTTASVADAVRTAPAAERTEILPAFFDHPAYIAALSGEARRHLALLAHPPERVLLSFHALPRRYVARGDPYRDQCVRTAALLRAAMGWPEDYAPMTFQSKFGPGAWLEPATEKTLIALAKAGVRRVAVMTPGFVSDCIETLEEIAMRGRAAFLAHGGAELAALPCLNDSDAMADLLEQLTQAAADGRQ